jgi:pimeloyl-ACP methyl ester carboxylesterase
MVRSVVFGGLGIGMVEGLGGWEGNRDGAACAVDRRCHPAIGRACSAPSPIRRAATGIALAACIETSRKKLTADQAGDITAPALIAVGTKDDIAGSPQELAELMPNATALDIPGRDHMLAVGDRVFKAAALEFLAAH